MRKLILFAVAVLSAFPVFGIKGQNHSHLLRQLKHNINSEISEFTLQSLNHPRQNQMQFSLQLLKKGGMLKQRLDSVLYPGNSKEVFNYDINGRNISDSYLEWRGNSWENSEKSEYIFDSKGLVTLENLYYWDEGKWNYFYKMEYSYGPDENLVSETISTLVSDNHWFTEFKIEYVYDENGNRTTIIFYMGTGSGDNELEEVERLENAYDENGNIIQVLYSLAGENRSRSINSFDEHGNVILITSEMWENDQWITDGKTENLFNESSQMVESFVYSRNIGTVEWELVVKHEYTYDDNGYLTNYSRYNGDFLVANEESVYDEYGNLVEFNESNSYYPGGNSFLSKTIYTYDNSFTFEDLILPVLVVNPEFSDEEFPDLNLMFKHKLTNVHYSEHDGSSWEILDNSTLYYSEQTVTGIDEFSSEDQVALYPNPATNQITFQLEGKVGQFYVQLFDVQGKMIFQHLVQNNRPVSTQFLEDGLYLYRLTANDQTYSGKFILKK